jgi:hypothetical protein
MFLVTLMALPTAGIGSAQITVTTPGISPLVLEVTGGRFASAQMQAPGSTFNFEATLEIDGTNTSAIALNIPTDGGLHVQVIGASRAVGHIVHDLAAAAAQALELACPNNPSYKVTCPGSLRCTDPSGGDFTLTC